MGVLLGGAPGFFTPRMPPPFLHPPGSPRGRQLLRHRPLKATLERLVDFDRINAGEMRFSVGAVNVRTGNFVYFDSTTHQIGPEHVIASGSLPPGFPADRDRRRALLGWRPRVQYAAAMGARQPAAAGHARLPGRSLERARRVAARPHRVRGAPEGHPLFEPHAGGDRSSSRKRSCSVARPPSSSRSSREMRGKRRRRNCWRRSRRESLQHHPPDLPREEITRAPRRTSSSHAGPWRSIGSPATTTPFARCVTRRCSSARTEATASAPSTSLQGRE